MRPGKLAKFAVQCSTQELLGVALNRLRDEANGLAASALALERANETARARQQNARAVRATWCCETLMYALRVYRAKETPISYSDALERFERGLKELAAAHRRVEDDVRARAQ